MKLQQLTILASTHFFWNLPFGRLITFCFLAILLQATPASSGETDSANVSQILNRYCSGCHNDQNAEATFSVGSYNSVVDFRSDSGPLIVKGDPDQSRLLQLITGAAVLKMPPSEEPQPTLADIELIRTWIKNGTAMSGANSVSWQDNAGPESTTRALHLPPAPSSAQFVSSAVSVASGLLALGRHSQIELFDTSSQSITNSIMLKTGRVSALRMSPGEQHLIVGAGRAGVKGQVILIDVKTNSVLQDFQGHSDAVYAIAMSPDGKYLASGSYDRSIIIWDLGEGKEKLRLTGHNGAVTDLDFHPSGELLASTSTDGTVKLWHVPTGNRLDTLGQPEGDMRCVRFSMEGSYLLASGADKQIRCWKVASTNRIAINPLLESRFAHEKDILRLAVIDSQTLISCSADGTTKAWTIPGLIPITTLWDVGEVPVDICNYGSAELHLVGLNGNVHTMASDAFLELNVRQENAKMATRLEVSYSGVQAINDVGGNLSPASDSIDSATAKQSESEPNDSRLLAVPIPLPARVKGVIVASTPSANQSDIDFYGFHAQKGEAWIFEIVASRQESSLDSFLDILDSNGQPVLQTKLQALRESYFTFRGKDSSTSDDFRLHKWEDMELDEYLYANSEVTRLWLYPRGPDSGFKVYPGSGARHTFFGTTPVAHALGDLAFIVRPLRIDEIPLPNGLPVFPVYFENDDDPGRKHGRDSIINFRAPSDGDYFVRVRDARGFTGNDFSYELVARRPRPDYQLTVSTGQLSIPRGSGREWAVSVERLDGMNQAIEITLSGLPQGAMATNPVVIEAGQLTALGTIFIPKDAELTSQPLTISMTARARVSRTDQDAGNWPYSHEESALHAARPLTQSIQLSVVELSEPTLRLLPAGGSDQAITEVDIQPGQTISARLTVERHGLEGNISCGRDDAGRNMPHGAFVDNVGLNGLLITEGNSSREIFITAAPKLKTGRYQFHFRTETAGNPTSGPIWLNVTR